MVDEAKGYKEITYLGVLLLEDTIFHLSCRMHKKHKEKQKPKSNTKRMLMFMFQSFVSESFLSLLNRSTVPLASACTSVFSRSQ